MRGSFFARNNLSDFLPLSNHDDLLAGDTLTTLTLNHEWRVFIMATIENLMNDATRKAPDSELDTLESQFLSMFLDFYN